MICVRPLAAWVRMSDDGDVRDQLENKPPEEMGNDQTCHVLICIHLALAALYSGLFLGGSKTVVS